MLTLPLEPTDDRADPAFRDATSCVQWLAQLQLTNLHQAHSLLRTQLDQLNRYPMRGLERLNTLESLRDTISAIQADYAKKLIAKKLPLSNEELTLFTAIISLWKSMVTGYQRCLQAREAGDAQLASKGALLCQRCLLYSGLQIFEYQHTGYEFDAELWLQLHALYAFSEEQGWQTEAVLDEHNPISGASSCHNTYIKILLTCRAHRADLSRHQLQLLDRWLTEWSSVIVVTRREVIHAGDAPPLVVDLNGRLGAEPVQVIPISGNLRYLDMTSLSKLMRVKSILLQQGHSPLQLELGEGCNSTECMALLNYLHQCWCEGQDDRLTVRLKTAQQAQVCYGMESCFAYISSRPFKQPFGDAAIDTISRKQIIAFGRVLSETRIEDLAVMGHIIETWQIEDESIRGTRLLRETQAGVRLSPGMLVAVRPTNANVFLVGTISWVKVIQTGQLRAGVRYLPGLPQAIAMKEVGVNLTVSSKFVAALLLPDVPGLKTPASLIAPRDWYKPGRVIEIVQVDKKKLHLKMELSIEKGSDYERISFSEIQLRAE